MEIIYSTRPDTRHAAQADRSYPVREIIVAGEVVGALYRGDGFLFGEVRWPDGTRGSFGDCTLDTAGADDSMVRWIMARRTLPPTEDKWRGRIHRLCEGWTVRCAD